MAAAFLLVLLLPSLFAAGSLALQVHYGSAVVGRGNFIPLDDTASAPSVDIQGYGSGSGHLYSFIMVDQKALPRPTPYHVFPYINYWVANIPAGSSGKLGGNVLEPYVAPSHTPHIPLPWGARNHTFDCVLVQQRNPIVRPMVNRTVISLPDILSKYHCGNPLKQLSFTTTYQH